MEQAIPQISLKLRTGPLGPSLLAVALLLAALQAVAFAAGVFRWLAVSFILLVLAVVVTALVRGATALRGTEVVQRGLWWTRSVDLATAPEVRLVAPRGIGRQVCLIAGRPRRGVLVDLYVWTNYARTGQPAGALRALAAAVKLSPAVGAGEIAAQLEAQADHLDGGGPLPDSPLAAFARDRSERGH